MPTVATARVEVVAVRTFVFFPFTQSSVTRTFGKSKPERFVVTDEQQSDSVLTGMRRENCLLIFYRVHFVVRSIAKTLETAYVQQLVI